MLLDLHARPFSQPDRQVLSELDWSEVAAMWDNNQLGQLHDWLNERWSRLVRDSVLGNKDPEAEFLQALAFAVLALLMADDALMALNKYRPSYLGVAIDPIVGTLQELRPMLCGLAADDPCPLYPFACPKFQYFHSAP